MNVLSLQEITYRESLGLFVDSVVVEVHNGPILANLIHEEIGVAMRIVSKDYPQI